MAQTGVPESRIRGTAAVEVTGDSGRAGHAGAIAAPKRVH